MNTKLDGGRLTCAGRDDDLRQPFSSYGHGDSHRSLDGPHDMNQTWIAALAAAETRALDKQFLEEIAYNKFCDVRTHIESAHGSTLVVDAPEFDGWMKARHETDLAWGAWAMVMDTRPAP